MNRIKLRSTSLYRVIPTLVRSGIEQTVTVYPIGEAKRFCDDTEYIVSFIPREVFTINRLYHQADWDTVTVRAQDGALSVTYTFADEQEWVISVTTAEDIEKKKAPLEFFVYSLFDDLYERDPYLGDLHVHSCRSDGKEDPAVVAANYRREGFDFLALTDHKLWQPSDDMIKTYAGIPLGVKLFHGEEVHIPTSAIHMVNFGGSYSVNDLYRNNSEEIDAKIKADAEKLQPRDDIHMLDLAYRKWITEEIRKAGGLSIVAHPHWICRQTYNMNRNTLDEIFEKDFYDAFELIGGNDAHGNNLQTAFYSDQLAKGRRIPIVGSSDSHGTDPANYFCLGKTIVFAKDCELDTLCGAIKDTYSVAIEHRYGEEERVFGSYRLVTYARFLLDHYFPYHNEFCFEEGILMREYLLGDKQAGEALAAAAERTRRKSKLLLRGVEE